MSIFIKSRAALRASVKGNLQKKKKKEKKFDPRVVFFKREREKKKSPSTDRAAYVFDATARGVSVQPVAALDTEQSDRTFSHTQKTKTPRRETFYLRSLTGAHTHTHIERESGTT